MSIGRRVTLVASGLIFVGVFIPLWILAQLAMLSTWIAFQFIPSWAFKAARHQVATEAWRNHEFQRALWQYRPEEARLVMCQHLFGDRLAIVDRWKVDGGTVQVAFTDGTEESHHDEDLAKFLRER